MTGKIRPNFSGEVESVSKSSIQIELDITASGTGQILRNGQEVTQEVRRARPGDLRAGVKLLHRVDGRSYVVASATPTAVVVRADDGTTTEAAPEQVVQLFWLVDETCG